MTMPQIYKFQQDVIDVASTMDNFAFLWEPGSGKTCAVINTVLQKLGKFPKTLIFAPKIALNNWKNELKMWAPDERPEILMGNSDKKKKIIDRSHILILNYEAVRGKEVLEVLQDFQPTVVILDESHRIKDPRSLQSKAIYKITRTARYRYILTGTVATNSYMDLWSQWHFLDNGDSLGSSFFSFRKKYFINKNAGWVSDKAFPNYVFNEAMKPELLSRISHNSSFIKAKDVVDLPDLIKQDLYLPMVSDQIGRAHV